MNIAYVPWNIVINVTCQSFDLFISWFVIRIGSVSFVTAEINV